MESQLAADEWRPPALPNAAAPGQAAEAQQSASKQNGHISDSAKVVAAYSAKDAVPTLVNPFGPLAAHTGPSITSLTASASYTETGYTTPRDQQRGSLHAGRPGARGSPARGADKPFTTVGASPARLRAFIPHLFCPDSHHEHRARPSPARSPDMPRSVMLARPLASYLLLANGRLPQRLLPGSNSCPSPHPLQAARMALHRCG